jgi:hypothetical protein
VRARARARRVRVGVADQIKKILGIGAALGPLDDAICSRNSIYMIKQDGSLWTVKSDGEAYSKVRELDRVVARDVYVCLSCKAQWRRMPGVHPEAEL